MRFRRRICSTERSALVVSGVTAGSKGDMCYRHHLDICGARQQVQPGAPASDVSGSGWARRWGAAGAARAPNDGNVISPLLFGCAAPDAFSVLARGLPRSRMRRAVSPRQLVPVHGTPRAGYLGGGTASFHGFEHPNAKKPPCAPGFESLGRRGARRMREFCSCLLYTSPSPRDAS